MAFDKSQHYLIRFSLPDGEHLMCGHSVPNIKEAEKAYRRILEINPEAKFISIERSTPESATAAEAELRSCDPSRPLAGDMGFDTPNRILTNPEMVPGSTFVRPPSE